MGVDIEISVEIQNDAGDWFITEISHPYTQRDSWLFMTLGGEVIKSWEYSYPISLPNERGLPPILPVNMPPSREWIFHEVSKDEQYRRDVLRYSDGFVSWFTLKEYHDAVSTLNPSWQQDEIDILDPWRESRSRLCDSGSWRRFLLELKGLCLNGLANDETRLRLVYGFNW